MLRAFSAASAPRRSTLALLLSACLLVLALAGCRPRVDQAAASASRRPRVCATSYPLFYFAQRLAGDRAEVVFPAPPNEDPVFWRPSREVIRQYQQADLVLLNGADFEKWVNTTSLPLAPQVDTSAGFKSEWLMFPEVITHSHGPQGMHSHGNVDYNTWLDPLLALRQAETAASALGRLFPEREAAIRQRSQELRRDLLGLDQQLRDLSLRLAGQPLLASHPVYAYLARRYHWALLSVHWEPDEPVPEAQWAAFDALRARHPGTLMLWEEEPLPAVRAELQKRGVRPVVFETCGNRPPAGDYLQAMRRNIDELRTALASNQR
jgi:zinc transport system substrate-binding protein